MPNKHRLYWAPESETKRDRAIESKIEIEKERGGDIKRKENVIQGG